MLHQVYCQFSNKGVRLPLLKLFPDSIATPEISVDVTLIWHSRGWSSDLFVASCAEQQQLPQQACSLSADALLSLCSTSHVAGYECCCKLVGTYKAMLRHVTVKGEQKLTLVGIQHAGELLDYRPKVPNHMLQLVVKVSLAMVCCLGSVVWFGYIVAEPCS